MGKKYSLYISFILAALLLTGCDAESLTRKVVFTTGFSDNEVFRIEDSVCSLQEVMVYFINTRNGYESTFGSEIWSAETDDGTIESKLKDSVLSKTAQIKTMNLLAVEDGIELTEEEQGKVAEAASVYYESLSEADIAAMKGAELSTITKVYEEYTLADKLYDYIIRDINPEISDDEARTITVEQIFLKTYSLDASGEKVTYSDSEKAAVLTKLKSIKSTLLEGTSFEELMAEYNEADEGTISFGKGEMEEIYEETAFNLGTDEVSDIIETSEGYVLIKCISTFNRQETENNKVRIVEERKKEAFGERYDAFAATLTKELNQELWDSITVSAEEGATTSNLWEVYREYFPD